jgi:hypothetical protein
MMQSSRNVWLISPYRNYSLSENFVLHLGFVKSFRCISYFGFLTTLFKLLKLLYCNEIEG